MSGCTNPIKFKSPTNPNPLKVRLARAFLLALARVNSHPNPNPPSPLDTLRKCRRVRIAAYASMASAVGLRRAWSRSILRKIRKRVVRHNPNRLAKEKNFRRNVVRKRKKRNNSCENRLKGIECGTSRHENKLRKLVPGGEKLEFSCLLEETADYIKCLVTQVQVMRSIADFYSV